MYIEGQTKTTFFLLLPLRGMEVGGIWCHSWSPIPMMKPLLTGKDVQAGLD